jgi:hypothetical protein
MPPHISIKALFLPKNNCFVSVRKYKNPSVGANPANYLEVH